MPFVMLKYVKYILTGGMGMEPDLSHYNERSYIYALKSFAVVSIVAAHSGSVFGYTNKWNVMFSWILNQLGSIGVGIFFIVSGYLFYKNSHSFKIFFRKKVNTIFLPWLITGTSVYLYVTLRKDAISIDGWLNYLIGNGSYLYYLTLLILFYILFFFTSKNKIFVYCTIWLSVGSILLTATGVLDGLNNYLNPLNFICYFSAGLILASKNSLIQMAYKFANYKILLIAIYIILLCVLYLFEISSGYWGYATLIVQPVAIMLIFSLCTAKFVYNDKILTIGIESFSIYLLHMPVAGLIAFIFNHFDLWILTLTRPFIVVCITFAFIWLYKTIGSKLKIDSYSNKLIGAR